MFLLIRKLVVGGFRLGGYPLVRAAVGTAKLNLDNLYEEMASLVKGK